MPFPIDRRFSTRGKYYTPSMTDPDKIDRLVTGNNILGPSIIIAIIVVGPTGTGMADLREGNDVDGIDFAWWSMDISAPIYGRHEVGPLASINGVNMLSFTPGPLIYLVYK